jgi:hypothetical protein
MRPLTASELLGAWERGQGQRLTERALTLLAATDPHSPRDALANLSIGRRDASLLSLREEMFGSNLISLAECPGCGERLELSFQTADVRGFASAVSAEESSVSVEDWQVRFRLPNSADLLALGDSKDPDEGRALLLRRCILSAEKNHESKEADELPEHVIAAVVQRMAEADAQADVQLALDCPLCGHQWQSPFDIVSFLWTEINAWAHRTLRDVNELARAYGWREADILALSPLRRQIYLEMIGR